MKSRIQLLIQLFWSCWFTVVVTTNILDALKACGFLPSRWKMASGNFENIMHTTRIYDIPNEINVFLFIGVIGWELLCTFLFWMSLLRRDVVVKAFFFSIGLFSAFVIASEIFLDFAVANTHIRLLILLFVSLIAYQRE